MLPPRGAQVALRLKQFEAYQKDTLPWAREFVAGKLANAEGVLRHLRKHQDDPGPRFERACERLAEEVGKVRSATDHEALLGFEGAASKVYFEAFWLFNKSEFVWEGRRMHPPPDALNSLLSLAYTLLTSELTGLLEACGLDPYLGLLHQIDYNRPSLALDVIEAFRYPLVDRFVLRLVNRKQFQKEDFQASEVNGAVHLRPTALKRFLSEYEQTLLGRNESYAWRETLRGEVQGLARALREGEAFRAFRFAGEEETR